jgi:hypothetical protein
VFGVTVEARSDHSEVLAAELIDNARGNGGVVTATIDRRQFAFTTRPHLAVDDTTGDPIGLDDLDVRIRWLLDLITGAETDLLIPTTSAPTTRAQWRAVRLTATLPPHLHGRAVTQWHRPTLTFDGRGLLLRCAATEAVPTNDLAAGTVAVGVDWSPATLGAAAIATDTGDGLMSDYQGYTYDDRGLGIKLARLQDEGQRLHRKSARRKAADALAHTAVRVGAVAVTVPARGSSALCPGCNAPLARPGGYHHAWCESCRLGGNRDHVAG